MPRDVKIQSRRGTASEWTSVNPVLALGELGVETDTHKIKAGDDETHWNDLPYVTGPVDGDTVSLQVKRDTETNLAASTTPIPDGTLVYNQTTGRMKIGDGETLWQNLPDPGKQFKNVITVAKDGAKGSADFICSGYDSDVACVQDAIDKVKLHGTITVLDGAYDIGGIIAKTDKSFNLVGQGNVIFNCHGAGDDTPVIQFYGSTLPTTYTLSTDANAFTDTLTLTAATDIQAGDLFEIYNTDQWCPGDYPLQKTGEMYEVYSVLGNTVVLTQNLLRQYLASNTSVIIHRPIHVNIENITFLGTGVYDNVFGIALKYCSNSHINKCTLLNHGRRTLILNGCYNFELTGNYIANSCYGNEITGYSGYGIGMSNACAIINISHNRIENCRHCVMSGTGEFRGLNRAITIDNNTIIGAYTNASDLVDSHEMTIDYTVTNNKFYPKTKDINGVGYGWYAFLDGTQHSIFSNNYVYGGGGVRRRSSFGNRVTNITNNILKHTNGASLYYYNVGGTNNSMIINNNQVIDCLFSGPTYGSIIEMAGESYKHLEICNNVFDNCSIHAMNIKQAAGVPLAQFNISNNVISDTVQNAIYLIRQDTTTKIDSVITGNIITTTGANAIYLIDIAGAKVANNIIRGAYYGIRENTLGANASDYNEIYNNTISENTSTAIVKIGANTKIFNNPGYKTENTGTATISASATSVTISHGLVAAPTKYSVTPSANVGNCWMDTPTSTQMTIHCSTAPEADTVVSWSAQVV